VLLAVVTTILIIAVARCGTGTTAPKAVGTSRAPAAPASPHPSPSPQPSPSPSPSVTIPPGPTPVDASAFAPGACVAFPPTSGNRHTTVFLDAGHGGPDPGAEGITERGTSIAERELTLPTVMDTVPLLRAQGYRVVVSRTTDGSVAILGPGDTDGTELSVQGDFKDTAARDICANEAGAAILVSVHFNAGGLASDGGMLTAYDDARPFAGQSLALATLLQHDIVAAMNAAGNGIPDDGVVNDAFSGAPALSAAAAAYGRLLILGPAEPGYFSTPSTMPGALVEPLFLTDPFEGSLADSSAGQHEIATGIAQAVETYLSRQATPAASSPTP
jgi:N-acetylmuramoyl-L-alanine amidase